MLKFDAISKKKISLQAVQCRHGEVHNGVLLAVGEPPAVTAVSDAGDSSSPCRLKTFICSNLSLEHAACQKQQSRGAEWEDLL